MRDKPGKPRWDVRAHLHEPEYNETYRKINLLATLTWGLTHQQVYVDLALKDLLDEMLFGATIDDAYDSGFLVCEKPSDLKRFKKAVSNLAQLPEAANHNLRHFYCEDCSDFENVAKLYKLFKELRETGRLDLEFFERFNKESESFDLGRQPEEAARIDSKYLNKTTASKTISDYYSESA